MCVRALVHCVPSILNKHAMCICVYLPARVCMTRMRACLRLCTCQKREAPLIDSSLDMSLESVSSSGRSKVSERAKERQTLHIPTLQLVGTT